MFPIEEEVFTLLHLVFERITNSVDHCVFIRMRRGGKEQWSYRR
jgi:hypothetical protein